MERQRLEFTRGDDEEIPFSFTKGDGTAKDITGWTVYFTVKNQMEDSDSEAILSKETTTHDAPLDGYTTFVVPSSVTSDLGGMYVFDGQYKKPDGTVKTFMKGIVEIEDDVTLTE